MGKQSKKLLMEPDHDKAGELKSILLRGWREICTKRLGRLVLRIYVTTGKLRMHLLGGIKLKAPMITRWAGCQPVKKGA